MQLEMAGSKEGVSGKGEKGKHVRMTVWWSKKEVRYSNRPTNTREIRAHKCTRRNRAGLWVLRMGLGGFQRSRAMKCL